MVVRRHRGLRCSDVVNQGRRVAQADGGIGSGRLCKRSGRMGTVYKDGEGCAQLCGIIRERGRAEA